MEELEHVSHTESLAMAPEDLQRLKLATSQDVAMPMVHTFPRQRSCPLPADGDSST